MRNQIKAGKNKKAFSWLMIVGVIITIVSLLLYVYFVRTGKIQPFLHEIRHLGVLGILLSIFILAILCVLPIPSELMIIFIMEVYGAVGGFFYSWIGGIVGAIAAMYITEWIAKPLVDRFVPQYIEIVDTWLHKKGTVGLLALRFIPFVPYHFVNYAAGVLRVRVWPFTWTTALGILPYDLAMAGIFSGIRHGALLSGIAGGVIFIILMLLGWLAKKQKGKQD